MYLDENDLTPCAGCGRRIDGDVCDDACAELADAAARERERLAKRARRFPEVTAREHARREFFRRMNQR